MSVLHFEFKWKAGRDRGDEFLSRDAIQGR